MKKLALIAAVILTPASWASNNNNEPMDQEPVLRSFVTHVNELTRTNQLLEVYAQPEGSAYRQWRVAALSAEILKRVPLDSKYNLVVEIFKVYETSQQKPCEPVHVAQSILDSFDATLGAKPEVLHSMMKLFIKTVKPKTENLIFNAWGTYAFKQARNPELSIGLRKKFAKLYLLAMPGQEAFTYKLLAEISASK